MFPDAFREFNGNDPSDVDVIYKWFAPLQRLIGTDQNTGAAKLLHVIIFASLCGTYRSGTQTNLMRAFDKILECACLFRGHSTAITTVPEFTEKCDRSV